MMFASVRSDRTADRILAAEKTERPLSFYQLGDGFTGSLETLTDTQTTKALRCVGNILTGHDDPAARRVHPLRTSDAGRTANDPRDARRARVIGSF